MQPEPDTVAGLRFSATRTRSPERQGAAATRRRASLPSTFRLLGLLFALSAAASCEAENPDPYAPWVAAGWKLLRSVTGDLDRDGRADAVLVLEQADPANRRKNDGLGAPELNLNPRKLVVLLQTASGLRKVADADQLLPSEHDDGSPCLGDPLYEGGVRIAHGLLRIDLHYWMSCGSYGVTHRTFSFRYGGGRFRLIGADAWEFMRNSGARSEISINYLSGRKKVTTGLNEFEPSEPKISWHNIRTQKAWYLDEMPPSCDAEDALGEWCG